MFRKNEGERGKVRFEGSTPIPNVKNLSASLDYYIGILGFNKDWVDGDPPEMASVSRDKADIMLCQNAQGQPGIWIWVGVSDAELLFEEYKAHGAAILQEPMNYSWESDWILPYLRVSRNVANRMCSRSSVATNPTTLVYGYSFPYVPRTPSCWEFRISFISYVR